MMDAIKLFLFFVDVFFVIYLIFQNNTKNN